MKDRINTGTFHAAPSKRLLIRAAAGALAGLSPVSPEHAQMLAQRLTASPPPGGTGDKAGHGGVTRDLEIPGGRNIIDKNEAGGTDSDRH